MTVEIQITHQGKVYLTKSFTFPGGELQVQIPGLPESLIDDATIIARLQSSEAIIRLLLVTEILRRSLRSGQLRLVVPYFPYARQDRVMQPSEAFSLKAIARIINSLGFDEVVVCDPHSDVTPALIENVSVIHQTDILKRFGALTNWIGEHDVVLIAPDAGAAKKTLAAAKQFKLPMVTASKVRDTSTGEITATRLDDATGLVRGNDCLIVDDICDGGRTFIELAKVLWGQGARSVHLYVTHGIFSNGLGVFDGLIDSIFTTDSFKSPQVHDNPRVPISISTIQMYEGLCP